MTAIKFTREGVEYRLCTCRDTADGIVGLNATPYELALAVNALPWDSRAQVLRLAGLDRLVESAESECAPTLVALTHDDCVTRLTVAMRDADRDFERVGGSTRHHVRDCLLPALMRAGLWIGEIITDPCYDCMLSAPAMCGGAYCRRDAEGDRSGRTGE